MATSIHTTAVGRASNTPSCGRHRVLRHLQTKVEKASRTIAEDALELQARGDATAAELQDVEDRRVHNLGVLELISDRIYGPPVDGVRSGEHLHVQKCTDHNWSVY